MARFVGRGREVAQFEVALARVAGGRGGLVLVTGEAGIGKTRLCEEVTDRAGAAGVAVGWARCWEAGAPPLWPWEQLLGERGMRTGLPERPAGSMGEEPELARLRFFDETAASVVGAARAQPWLLVIDDLHWADVASLLLLAYLAPQLRTAPVLVVATIRDGEVGPGSPLQEPLTDLGRHASFTSLGPMAPDELASLVDPDPDPGFGPGPVASVAGTASTPGLPSGPGTGIDPGTLFELSRGNPLFARELARLLGPDGIGPAAPPRGVGGVPVPPTVRAVVTHRLRRLSTPCRDLLSVCAVAGQPSVELVEAVSGLDRAAVLAAVDEAQGARVIEAAGLAVYAFTHPLWRAAVYEDLGVARRVRLHEQIGLALEQKAGTGREVDSAILAHHFVEAGPGGGAGRAVPYAVAAAEAARARLAFEDAAALYETALASLDEAPTAADRAEVLLGLGEAQAAAGWMADARESHLAAARLARAHGRPDQLARSALGLGGRSGFEVVLADREQIDLLEEALRATEGGPAGLRALVAARLSVALSLTGADERRRALSEEALVSARRSGDDTVLAACLAAHCDTIAGPEGNDRRLAASTEIIALATGAGDAPTELLGRRLRLVALLERGDMGGADAEIEAYARLASVVGQAAYRWYVPLWRAMRALMRGDIVGAERFLGEAHDLGVAAGSGNAHILVEGLRWFVMRAKGDAEGPFAVLGMLSELEPVLGAQIRVSMAVVLAEAGRLDEARAGLDRLAQALPALPRDSEWVAVMGQLAESIAMVGGHPVASWAYDALRPFGHMCGVEGIGAVCWGSVERPLGLLAASLGRRTEAVAHFDAAERANRSLGAPLLVATTLSEGGLALHDSSRLAAALAAYRELGLGARVAELEAHLSGTGGENVFRREGDVWDLRFAGRSAHLKDVKGLRDLARLLERPGTEMAALDLAGTVGAPHQIDIGPVLDEGARRAYRARLADLDTELEAADVAGDAARSERAQKEKEAIAAQLAGAVGLGGRARRMGASSERARQAVTWRVRDAIGRVAAVHPELGEHLRRCIRTGTYCAYEPPGPVTWSV
ncbi:MAG: AAA family ATPase [Actinomycetota bacterium]